ncbi:MAG TPA: ABC transporter permease [Chryseolinea sp.]|nr:ABC transporter permease [Chryseolinea sp.]
MKEDLEFVVTADRRKLFDWKELWNYRELVYFFTWRDVKIKYKQTILGFAWAVLQPLLLMVIFTLFFGRALSIPSQALPYPVFVFSGLILWNAFASGLTTSANSMVNNAQIIKKIYFPRLIIPISSIFVSLFDFLMAFVLFIPLLIYYRQPVSMNVLWSWPSALLLTLIATIGPGCLLSALNVKYRDFRYVIPFLVQILFFLTPVIYPVSLLKYPLLQYLIVCSPMYAVVELFRYPLTGIALNTSFIVISVVSAGIFLLLGIVYFKRTEDFFADLA